MEAVKSPVMLYTEQTPNPESLKFVTNKMLFRGTADFREASIAQDWSPLAVALFELPYVKGVYVCNNFITITKEFNYAWEDIMLKTKEFIKQYIENDGVIVKEGFIETMEKIEAEKRSIEYTGADGEIAMRIKEIIDTYVKPGVEMDGGNIEFKSFNNGVVSVIMQGSCSGCPSSTSTLKVGIEGMLKRMVPEVTEVVSEMG
jgi:NFU1 iron-sulfur cluster scaffold homolog, mitochondrial